jgi:hypothetical protein
MKGGRRALLRYITDVRQRGQSRRVFLTQLASTDRFSCGALERRESRNSGSAVFAQGFAGYVTQF